MEREKEQKKVIKKSNKNDYSSEELFGISEDQKVSVKLTLNKRKQHYQ